MKIRGILFSAPMVRKLWAGEKTQTRRLASSRAARTDVSDLLYVKETWGQFHPIGIREGQYSIEGQAGIPGPPGVNYRVIYRADGDPLPYWWSEGYPYRALTTDDDLQKKLWPKGIEAGWDSPLHLPRKWSRLTLDITDVRFEPLHDISEADAIAEGCEGRVDGLRLPSEHYAELWDELHGEGAWASNPEVVVLTFTAHKTNVDDLLKAREAAR